MSRGRKPKPKAIKILDGSADVNPGRVNHLEPRTLEGEPDCPPGLDAIGAAKWSEIVALHRERGTLCREMAGPLTTYCEVFSRKEFLRNCLLLEGMFVTGTHGTPIAHPALRTLEKAESMLLRLDLEFGFTPSSRSRCVVNAKPTDDLEDFLDDRKAE